MRINNPQNLSMIPNEKVEISDVSQLLRVLLINGFLLDKIRRVTQFATIFECHRFDILGAKVDYAILLSNKMPGLSVRQHFNKIKVNRTSIAVGFQHGSIKSYTLREFLDLFGGPIDNNFIFADNLSQILKKLGHNTLPSGMSGDPDDLLEKYSKDCLQFCLDSRAIRYGQERLFAKLPDGIILGRNDLILQYDSKAYGKSYSISADDIRRYSSYVKEYNQKYGSYIKRIHAFIVISGMFKQNAKNLQKKSDELYTKCQTRLVCIKSEQLGKIVDMLKKEPEYRKVVNWEPLFSSLFLDVSSVKAAISEIKKDKIITKR